MLSWRDAPLNAQIGVDLCYLLWSLLVQILKLASLLVCLGLLTPVCHAQSMPITSRPQAAVSPIPEQLRAQLMLSSAQVNDIVRLHEQYRQESGEVRARLATLRVQQPAAAAKQPGLRNRPPDNAERDALIARMDVLGARYRSVVRALLSDTQRARLDQLERAAELQPAIEQAQCFGFLTKTPPDEPAACGQYQREP